MDQKVQEAVEVLFSTCIEVTMAGKYNAAIDFSAHTNSVNVSVFSSKTVYDGSHASQALLRATVYPDGLGLASAGTVTQKLNELTDKLSAYLLETELQVTEDPSTAMEWLRSGRSIRISAESACDLSRQAQELAEQEARRAA